jgi:hypothetical protein
MFCQTFTLNGGRTTPKTEGHPFSDTGDTSEIGPELLGGALVAP